MHKAHRSHQIKTLKHLNRHTIKFLQQFAANSNAMSGAFCAHPGSAANNNCSHNRHLGLGSIMSACLYDFARQLGGVLCVSLVPFSWTNWTMSFFLPLDHCLISTYTMLGPWSTFPRTSGVWFHTPTPQLFHNLISCWPMHHYHFGFFKICQHI